MSQVSETTPVPIKLDEDSSLHYIIGNKTILFENGVIVPRTLFDSRFAAKKTITALVEEAKRSHENRGWDFKRAVKTGFLLKLGAPIEQAYKDKAEKKDKVDSSALLQAVKKPLMTQARDRLANLIPSKIEVPGLKSFFSAPHADVITIILFVGLLCLVMSMYHTDMFLLESGKPRWVALIAAITMVTFSATAYTVARHVAQDHGIGILMRFLISVLLIVCGTATIAFSVFATFNVSYEQFRDKAVSTVTVAIEKDNTVTTGNELVGDKKAQIDDVNAQIAGYERDAERFYSGMNKELPTSDDPNDPVVIAATREKRLASNNYSRVQGLLEAARAKRDKFYAEKQTLMESHDTAIQTVKNTQASAYSMVAGKLGIPEDTVQFIIYFIPSVFFDIISPFAIAIVLLLNDRRKGIKKLSLIDRLLEALSNKITGGNNG